MSIRQKSRKSGISRQNATLATYRGPNRNLHHKKLRLEALEDRRLLATFLETGSTLMLALGANEHVGIVSHGDSYSFSLGDTGTWAGEDNVRVTSQKGTPDLAITPAGLAGFSDISIFDSGTGASVRFEDSGAHVYSTDISVVLDNGGAESATVTGAADFGICRVNLTARQIAVDGQLTATELHLTGSESLTVTGAVSAPAISLTAGLLDNSGELSSSGATGGQLSIAADRFINSGRITADGCAGAGGDISIALSQRMIQTQSGLVSASGVGGSGGKISIVAGDGTPTIDAESTPIAGVYLSGTVSASGSGTEALGGEIAVTGQQLDLYAAALQANGDARGGRIRVGGDFHGQGDLERAQLVTVNHASVLSADALFHGNGGQVVVWSELQTNFAGLATARGGVQQGDGGKIEISGQAALDWQGETNLSAPVGQPGSLLLDPKNITVVGTGPTFAEFVDPHPAAGNQFGSVVVPLSTGNVVITSPFDDFGAANAGAAYLFNGTTGALISALRGSHANDWIGIGVTALTNGNFVIQSPYWDNGTATDAGAATWASGTVGVAGTVSVSNSLVGSHVNDQVGGGYNGRVISLASGNYLVQTPYWNNSFGAVTWGSGTIGVKGVVSSANSLIGADSDSGVGWQIVLLTNGNYVVVSNGWDNGALRDIGAVTWGSGLTGVKGLVSSANSLVGSTTGDMVGYNVIALTNGNYVVGSYWWDNGAVTDAGAVTWCNGTMGVTGVVSNANSLVGSTVNESVGVSLTALKNGNYVFWGKGAVTWEDGTASVHGTYSIANSLVGAGNYIVPLTNGNYVVVSSWWNNGSATNAGAVTWGSGTTGVAGVISSANSLVGSTAYDQIGAGVTALANGNYVVRSPYWDNGSVADAGAVTWGNGSTGVTGVVSSANSLVGSTANDNVGSKDVAALTNGNYVVPSPLWNNGTVHAVGAVTWGNGVAGTSGAVSSTNSLIGSTTIDEVGSGGVTPLSNGNYVVITPFWNNGATSYAGAVTWGDGTTGMSGQVSSLNSLVGSTTYDRIGIGGVIALTNGNYVVSSYDWNNGTATNAGAVTWGNGTAHTGGAVSIANSLVGNTINDQVGYDTTSSGKVTITPLKNGNYVVSSPLWDNGTLVNAGAATWGNGTTGVSGVISAGNSLLGLTSNTALQQAVADNVNGTFCACFTGEAGTPPGGGTYGGRIRLGSLNAPLISQTFAAQVGQSLTFNSNVAASLNLGAALTLQASNDITISSAIVANNPSGNGGNLTLQAGRSVLINANISTDNGNLTLTANDTVADGVVDADRDGGSAVIVVALGKTLNAGTGTLMINLRNSTDKTYNDRGIATLQNIAARTIVLSEGTFVANGHFSCSSLLLDHATLILNADNVLSAGTIVTIDGGVLDFNGKNTAIGNIVVNGGGQVNATTINNAATTISSGTLTVASIVCDALTVGSAGGTTTNTVPANVTGAITTNAPRSVPGVRPAKHPRNETAIDSTKIDSSTVFEQSVDVGRNVSTAMATSTVPVTLTAESSKFAPPATTVVSQAMSALKNVSTAKLPGQMDRQSSEALLPQPSLRKLSAWAFADLSLASRLDRQSAHALTGQPTINDRLGDSALGEFADSLAMPIKQPSTAFAARQSAHGLRLQSVLSKYQQNYAVNPADTELFIRECFCVEDHLVKLAVDEIYKELVPAIDE